MQTCNFITAEYYSFMKGNEKIFGNFQISIDNADEYVVKKFKYLGKIVSTSHMNSIHQICGMEELAEMYPEVIMRVKKTTKREAISVVSKLYYKKRDVNPFEPGMTGLYVIDGHEDKYPPSNQYLMWNNNIRNQFFNQEYFIDKIHTQTHIRFLLREKFKSNLRSKYGCKVDFTLENVPAWFMGYVATFFPGSSDYSTSATSSRKKALLRTTEERFLMETMSVSKISLQSPTVEWLIPMLGDDYYYDLDHANLHVGNVHKSFDNMRFAYIPHFRYFKVCGNIIKLLSTKHQNYIPRRI